MAVRRAKNVINKFKQGSNQPLPYSTNNFRPDPSNVRASVSAESNRTFMDGARDIGWTGRSIFEDGKTHFSQEGNLGTAFKGALKASAGNATLQGGIAAVQGDDPWAAAKDGAVSGAFLGAGYMGLKGSLGANKKFGQGGMKEIGSGLKDRFKQNSNVSKSLQAKLQNDRNANIANNFINK